jgi:cytochrome c oxidase cbb3-type subunit 3
MTVLPSILMALICAVAVAAGSTACKREDRHFPLQPMAPEGADTLRLTSFRAGGSSPASEPESPYRYNAPGINEGKRLYSAYNCAGCHALAGGGGMGPALSDDKWIYGHAPRQIHASIVQGRPDGMPAWGDRIPPQQVWQLVAYIESMTGATSRAAAPGRADALSAAVPETRAPRVDSRQTGHR